MMFYLFLLIAVRYFLQDEEQGKEVFLIMNKFDLS